MVELMLIIGKPMQLFNYSFVYMCVDSL